MAFDIRLKRRKPKKLQDLCFLAVVLNFDEVTLRPGSEAGMRVLQTNSQLVLEKLRELWVLRVPKYRSIALFCVNRYLKELMLNEFHSGDVLQAIHKLAVGSTLITLRVPALSSNILWEIIHVLPETVQRIDLRSTDCTDNMLRGIAQQCPKLRELNLMYCSNITNAGVQSLSLKDEQGNICPNLALEILNLDNTSVTQTGIIFALTFFPNLLKINSVYLEEVLCYINFHSTFLRESSSNVCTFNLKSISSCKHGLKACFVLCPLVTMLCPTICTQEDFNNLMQFRLLVKVDLIVSGFFDYFTFFEARGNILEHLTVNDKEFAVPTEFIIKFCPRLEFLHLCCPFAEVKTKPVLDAQYTLRHLRVLQVESKSKDFLEESLMLLLSRSPNLKEFAFRNNDDFTSVSFQSSLVQNISMSTLKILELTNLECLVNERELLQTMPEFEYASFIRMGEFHFISI